ncbi:MAG: peptide/nickel transport system ATP-binding protein ddpF [Acidobacteriota bacterium]|nr:peptide/nickel transport system ATP-binding protein ddpF [Acidobacteriota bacterium]
MALLSAQNLTVSIENQIPNTPLPLSTPFLKNVSIDLRKDKITCLIGESGSGKTIFSKTIAALLPENVFIEQGDIFYKGKAIDYCTLKKSRGRLIFYSPQNAAASLNPVLKIKRQVNEWAKLDQTQLLDLFRDLEFQDPERVLNSYPFQLSGGENQRCLLAMAVAQQPELLILDEPTSAMDLHLQEEFMGLIKKVRQQFELTILLITHNLSLVRNAADYIYIILNGEIIEHGTPGDLLTSPGHAYTREIVNIHAALTPQPPAGQDLFEKALTEGEVPTPPKTFV